MRVPSYRLHKATGQAVVTLSGKDFYLGKFDSEESKAAYRRIIGEYLASHRSPIFGEKLGSLTMAQIAVAFVSHAEGYYGKKSKELTNFKIALKPIAELYADLPASRFSPVEFKACREWWLRDPVLSRQYINKLMKRIVQIVKWAVSEGKVPVEVHSTLKCVGPLKRGRTTAIERDPVKPVDDQVVDATVACLHPVVADMVQVQRLTGARPGEICFLTPSMIDRSGEVWLINLKEHKTAHRGKSRVIAVGPKAQSILAKYLFREGDAFCFSPKEAEAKRKRPMVVCGKELRDHYDTATYGRAIKRACIKAFPAPENATEAAKKIWDKTHAWAPNQLRHARATEIRKSDGLEAASVTLGHSGMKITEVYAEQNLALAIDVARRLG